MPHHYRTCSLCEALCGLDIEHEGTEVRRIRGDVDDVLSRGHVCPKGVAIADLHSDPDRLRAPQLREGDRWREISWDEAIERAVTGLAGVQDRHGRHALATYLGNPNVHHHGNAVGILVLQRALRTHNRFSATSADQLPHMFAALHMFGHQLLLGVPDLDRTDHLLIFGANPWASNGSLMSAGDVRGRIGAIGKRGGTVTVVDPRRTETARAADAHHFIRPGTDALLLLAMLHVILSEDLDDKGAWRAWTSGLDQLAPMARRFPPGRVAAATGMPADTIASLARAFATADHPVLYARIGVCVQPFGGLAAWLAYVLNLVAGRVDAPGGLMFTQPAVDLVGLTSGSSERGHYNWWQSRVRGLPEFGGELPVSALAEDIDTPGEGQIRGLLTVAGNPVLSTPEGDRLGRALEGLEFMVSVDLYRNETTRHADLILPASPPLARDEYPMVMQALAVRNIAKFSPALIPEPGTRSDMDILLSLAAGIAARRGRRSVSWAARAMRRLGSRRILDLALRTGPYGGWSGLSVAALERSPHGVDLGPLKPNLRDRLLTEDKRIHAAPEVLLADVDRLDRALEDGTWDGDRLVLIGRRQLRSNNSWMHNQERLVKGADRCTLLMHPADAAARGIEGGEVCVRTRVGEVRAPVHLSDEMMPGVVSLPHGWGHRHPGTAQSVAERRPGVSLNDLTDTERVDPLTGTAGFSGVAVEVEAAAPN